MAAHTIPSLKEEVRQFWDADPCGTRYLEGKNEFDAHARARYRLEPHIADFAQFASAAGLRVLEIGVGTGADYLEWLKAGAVATGVDISRASLEQARRRCESAGFCPELRVADAEHLPFDDNTFDIVYSYGVMHHSPDTWQCVRQAYRVLKPGGIARMMLYHHPSLTGLMLWLRYGMLRRRSMRQVVFDHLESPGTKTFTKAKVRAMLTGFENVQIKQVFSPGDLLLNKPSGKFRSLPYRLVWKLFPRALIRRFGRRWSLFLLVSARKASECIDPSSSLRSLSG